MNDCLKTSLNYNFKCFDFLFDKLYSGAKNSEKDLNVFFALMDGLSMDYHMKSYLKMISNLKSIKENKISFKFKNLAKFWINNRRY